MSGTRTSWAGPRVLSPRWLAGALIAGMVALASPSEAAIAFRASSQVETGNYVNSFSIGKPAGVVDGDVMIMTAATQDSNGSTVLDPPAGWTLVRMSYLAPPTNAGQVLYTWWKVAEGEPASYTLSFPAGLFKLAVVGIVAYSGVDTGNPIDAEGGQVNTVASPNVVAPSITTNRANTFLVGAFALDAVDPAPTYAPAGGMTERVDLAMANCCGGNWVSLELADEPRAAVGATGTRTAVASVGTHGNFGHLLALRPAFIVNSIGEQVDAAPGNGVCLTGVATCTLRAAIMESNALAGRDAINFAIPGGGPHTINVLAGGLPVISGTVAINAFTQPGASANTLAVGNNAVMKVELDGTATVGVNGLTLAGGATNSTIKGLVINRFADYGIQVSATGAIIRGNFVGTNVAGNAGLGNNNDFPNGFGGGIALFVGGATIGGTLPTQRNLVSGNSAACVRGIELNESSGNTIQGNYVGTNAAGTAAIPNGCGGVVLDGTPGVGSDNNLIGGAVAGAGNLLSGNQIEGIFIQIGSNTNTIQSNIIGLDALGTTAIPNGAEGIKIYAAGNFVGGDTALERNVISGNTLAGVLVDGEPADNNRIEGNYIGTDASGTLDRGNSQTGVTVSTGADNTRIGAPGAGNLISGNALEGVNIFTAGTTGTIVQGNKIGTNAAGATGIPNSSAGVSVEGGATGTQIGGIGAGEGNVIAFNGFPGVGVKDAATTASILGNSIFSNTQLGIDVAYDLVTPNDALDGDAGPNDLLNFPVISSVVPVGASLDVGFSLDVPAGSYRVEFFRNPAGIDPSGNGEGQVFAGFRNVTHPGGGSLPFTATIAGVAGDRITATASFCSDGAVCAAFSKTSEFSANSTTPTNYRSIGTAANYTLGTITVVTGSTSVTATGTAWVAANRGRGDRIFINGANYVVLSVNSDTSLTLATPYAGASASYSNPNYFIARQFTTLTAWEDCIDGPGGVACPFFVVASANLIADNRSEVGIAYNDAVGTDFAGGLTIDGAATDSTHTITLTADGTNRHYGLPGQGVLVDNGASALPAVQVLDDFVTVEWLEITGGGGTADGIRVNLLSPGTGSLVTVRNDLVHNVTGDGIALYDADGRVDVYNNIVHSNGNGNGVFINPGSLLAGSRLRILNNTVYNNGNVSFTGGGISKTAGASAATVLLRNNISVGNWLPDYAVDPVDSVDPASSNNLDEDNTGGTGAGTHNPAGGRVTSSVAGVAFANAGAGNLHIQSASSARDAGVDLSGVLARDIDATLRQSPWEIGADDVPLQVNYRSVGTAANDSTGSVTTTSGSALVGGVGTAWQTLNRGRGDVVSICDQAFPTCTTSTNYVVLAVGSNTQLTLTTAYAGTTGSHGYTIRRQFTTLPAWEDCVDGPPGVACPFFPVASASLAADNRSEVGIAYEDSTFTLGVTIDGSTTDAAHTITLTADGTNRHYGKAGQGVVIDNTGQAQWPVQVFDDFVAVEWLEIKNGDPGSGGITVNNLAAANSVVVRYNLIHNIQAGAFGIRVQDKDAIIDIIGNVVYRVADSTIYLEPDTNAWAAGARVRVLNNTVFSNDKYGIYSSAAANAPVVLRNNLSHSNPWSDYEVPALGAASSHNLASDASGTAHSPAGGGIDSVPLSGAGGANFVNSGVGTEDLHIQSTSLARDAGADLSGVFTSDIDASLRQSPWDIGADEIVGTALYRSVGITAAALASGAVNALTISGSTATFAVGLPNNIGVGDVIQYDSDGNNSIDSLAFIQSRTSSQSYAVKSKGGGTPTAVVGDNNWGIYRAYTALANWESQTENPNILEPFEDDVNPSLDLVAANTIMFVACYADGADTTQVIIDGWVTGAPNYIQIFTPVASSQVGASQRHAGAWDPAKYQLVASVAFGPVLRISDDYVRVTGLQIENQAVKTAQVPVGIEVNNGSATADVRVSSNILRATGAGVVNNDHAAAIAQASAIAAVVKAWNNVMYNWPMGFSGEFIAAGGYTLYNNTVIVGGAGDAGGFIIQADAANTYVAIANNLVQGSGVRGNYSFPGGDPSDYSATNLSQDATSPQVALRSKTVTFVGAPNYHLSPTDPSAKDQGTNLSADLALPVSDDIDGQVRQVPWDIGADDVNATTAVKLMSFEALAADAAVLLAWRTGSELDNLGFHLYRGLSEVGPWTRLNASLIPGLGSSAVGQAYSFRDVGLVNGRRYFYRLEDVDASSKTTSHGPVSAVPLAGAPSGATGSEPQASGARKKGATSPSCPDWLVAAYGSMAGASPSATPFTCTRHGDPEAVALGVVSRDSRQATLELKTGGFYALHEASGRVRVFVPGFDFPQDPQAPALPFRRALVDAVVGRRAQLGGVRALDQVGFPGLVPVSLGALEMEVARDGTVRAGRRAPQESAPQHVALDLARLLPSVFQGEVKSAVVQITPLRFDARRRQIVLAKRVLVKLLFTARETGESGRGSLGRRPKPEKPVAAELLARLYTTGRGLYAARFEQLFPGRLQGLASSQLRLERQGQAEGVHVEPASDVFGPGSVLYFYADATASSTDFSSETAWELLRARDGVQMPLAPATPSGVAVTTASSGQAAFEADRFYQPGLLEAEDLWLWEALASGATRAKSFSLTGVAPASSAPARLDVLLQGASESGGAIDHHVSVSVNGTLVGEAQFAGKKPYRMSLSLAPSLLHDGANELSLTNVADTGVSSLVFLDRFTIVHPQLSSLAGGRFDGVWPESGSVRLEVPAAVSGPVRVVDVKGPAAASGTTVPVWLTGVEVTAGAVRFRAEAGHRYWVGSDSALFSPRVSQPQASGLKSAVNQADYLLIAPRAFLTAAEPLLARRADQGLTTRAVAFEEIADEFGHGQPSAAAIKSFLTYAFQSWARPSPRYVLLLGDSTYDPRNFVGTSQPSPLPALWTKTTYLWTVSDPQLAAVNGEDALPDLAIGRLPATTVEEASRLVAKLLAWEDSGQGLAGAAALVADNPDLGGDFEADVDDIARSFLEGRAVSRLKLSQLGAGTRPAIQDALDSGLSFLSYVGHGGAAVWASENVWNSWDAPSLQAQSRQPLLLTLNCLNGYFVAPSFDSLSESLLKADGRGAIASFSPSGLSLDGPAHQYHRALMAELTSGQHQRLGDAVLAAQKAYAQTGLMPELLSVYHLLGDPAMRIR